MIIYRPHRGSLIQAMSEAKEFDSFEELQKFIVEDMKPFMNLRLCEIVASSNPINDDRIGWKDSDYLCIDGYENIEDKKGFELYFGGKYNHPLCIGMFATNYK